MKSSLPLFHRGVLIFFELTHSRYFSGYFFGQGFSNPHVRGDATANITEGKAYHFISHRPTRTCIDRNAERLGSYNALKLAV